jgi:hypothetical protein
MCRTHCEWLFPAEFRKQWLPVIAVRLNDSFNPQTPYDLALIAAKSGARRNKLFEPEGTVPPEWSACGLPDQRAFLHRQRRYRTDLEDPRQDPVQVFQVCQHRKHGDGTSVHEYGRWRQGDHCQFRSGVGFLCGCSCISVRSCLSCNCEPPCASLLITSNVKGSPARRIIENEAGRRVLSEGIG